MTSLPATLPRRSPRFLFAGTALSALVAGAIVATTLPPVPAAAQAVVIDQPVELPSFANVVEGVSPAVVAVRVQSQRQLQGGLGLEGLPDGLERFFRDVPGLEEPEPTPVTSVGSAFFVSADGYLVTNNHVIDGATEVTIVLDDGSQYEATLVGQDPQTDIAVLKVDADRSFTYVQFADDDPRIGDWVIAVGNPFGFGGTVTAGIVSARGRQISSSAFDDYLQIDAAVNTGNSGGPAFNLAGEVIGVNTAIYTPSGGNVGISFAVPAQVAALIVDDLRADGIVSRGWLGVVIQSVSENIADALGLPEAAGALVNESTEGTPATLAGVQPGDVILRVDDEVIDNSNDLVRTISGIAPGTEVALAIWRDGAETTINVVLADRAAAEGTPAPEEQQLPQREEPAPVVPTGDFGMEIERGPGGQPVVGDIDPNGTAAANGIQTGDIIVSVNTQPVDSVAEVESAVDAARDAGREAVMFMVEREGARGFFAIPF